MLASGRLQLRLRLFQGKTQTRSLHVIIKGSGLDADLNPTKKQHTAVCLEDAVAVSAITSCSCRILVAIMVY